VGRFGYTGQAWLPELGMWYYKARIYSPMLGRFLQVDPVGYKDQINLYAYVGNDPMDHTDPRGEMAEGCDAACKAKASAIMGETSGLRAQVTKGKDGKTETDPKSAVELRKGREAIGIISQRGEKLHSRDASKSTNPIVKRLWRESVTAAKNPDHVQLPPEAKQFFIRNNDDPAEMARVRNLGDPARETLVKSYGPFRSVGGGDAGKGDHMYIDIYAPRR
jgi:RHS repeat-associated protein